MQKTKHFVLVFGVLLLTLFSGISLTACNCDDAGVVSQEGKIKTNLPGDKRPNLIFTNAVVNKTNEQSFDLWNDGTAPITISAVKVVGQDLKYFKVEFPKLPLTLTPGENNKKKIKVLFTPTEAGEFQARIAITSSDASNVEGDGNFYVQLRNQNISPIPEFNCRKKIDFGRVALGKTSEKTCTITNSGSADLEIKKLEYVAEKNENDAYEIVEPKNFPITLKQGGKDKLELKIRFKPTKYPPAEAVGNMILHTNIKNETAATRHKVKLIGLIQVATIQLVADYPECQGHDDCRRIDSRLFCTDDAFSGKKLCLTKAAVTPVLKFPLTSKGSATTKKFRIRSTGELPLQVTQITLGNGSKDFKVLNPGLPFSLDPKAVKEITVEYKPSTDKPGKNTLTVSSNAGNKPKAPLSLEASTHGCDLQSNPKLLKFTGPQGFTLTLYNRGNQTCLVKSVAMKSGKNEPFALLPQPAPNQNIAPGGRLDMLVKFKPKSDQLHKDAVLVLSNDPDQPKMEIPVEGKINGKHECELKATPANLNFHLVAVGRSRQLRVGVTNMGWGICKISNLNVINLTPSGSSAFRLAGNIRKTFSLDSGKSIRMEVAFTPPQANPSYTGKLVIASNDNQNPNFEVKLSGASGTLCLEVVPANMDFGSTKFGCATPTRNIEIYNIGAKGCISPIVIKGMKCSPKSCYPKDPKAEFRINKAPTFPASLNKGQKIDIGMSYKAADLGVDSSTLELTTNIGSQSPLQIPLIGEGVATADQTDVFKQLDRPLTDIMFVIDDSCSMNEEQASLSKNFQAFIQWATRLNVDYHIAVTTTDVDGRRFPAGCFRCGQSACGTGTTKIIKPSTPNSSTTFARNVNVGTRGSINEKGFQAAFKALTPPATTGCNRGFYRKSASLSIIFVSDETEQSSNTLQFYVSFFRNLKGFRNLDLIRASSVVGPPPSGCRSAGSGNAFSAPRYWQIAKELRGVRASICSSNWANTLSNIGSVSFGYRTQYFLSRQADPKTIKVKVNGTVVKQDIKDGWQYEATNNSVNFSKSQIPPPNATVVVEYKAICLP